MRKTVLYYHIGPSPFVDKDISILKEFYTVKVFFFDTKTRFGTLLKFIRQFFVILGNSKKNTVVVSQFAGFHTVLPAIFSKISRLKSVIVLGGTDCVSFPSINYGNYTHLLLGKATCISLRYSDLLLPVHETLVEYEYKYDSSDFPRQGYLAHCKNVKTPFTTIYNGYDSLSWLSGEVAREPNSFVTVASGLHSESRRKLKGLDLIIDVSRHFPKNNFYIIGAAGYLMENQPENLHLLEKMPNESLNRYLQSKRFYLQLSMSEGFPNALCESMLSGCIPIVSNVGAMPYIIENSGFLLAQKSLTGLIEIINRTDALSEEELQTYSSEARHQIETRFTLEMRKEKFLNSIKSIG